jgi:biotin transport system substrate-specific component
LSGTAVVTRPRVLADLINPSWVADLVLVVTGAALVGVAAQLTVPVPGTPVPVTMQTFAVLLVGASLGAWRGAAAMTLYAVAGSLGLPWFADGKSGFGGATFGYVLGFIIAAALTGYLAERGDARTPVASLGTMVLGNLVIYAVGVPWLMASLGVPFAKALTYGFTPFFLGDALKLVLAALVLPGAWWLVSKVKKH